MDDDMIIRAAIRDEVSGPLEGIRRELRATGREAEQAGARAGRASSGWDRYAGGVGRVAKFAGRTAIRGLGLMASAATLAGTAAATVGIKTAASMETARIGFTTMLGSARKADAFLKQLAAFAAKTPFEFPELQTAASSLISAGISADKVIPIMTSLGDATAGMGTGSEGIKRATVALQQMNAAGRITGEDLNQLRDAGIPVYDLLAKATGKSKAQVLALAQAGKLGKKELDQMMHALESGKGLERFTGLMDKQSKTLSGSWSTLKDNVQMGLAKALQPAIPILTKLTGKAGELVAKGTGPLSDGLEKLVTKGTELYRSGALAKWADQAKGRVTEFWGSVGPLVTSLLELGKNALPTVVDGLKLTVKLIETGARVITPFVQGFNGLPDIAQKAIILGAAMYLLSQRMGGLKQKGIEAGQSLRDLGTKATMAKAGIGAAGAGLVAFGTSSGNAHRGLKDLATVAGGIAIGFATGGPFGAAVGGAAAVIGIFASKSNSAAEAQQKLDAAAQNVVGTLDQNTGAIGRNTHAMIAKQLADSGAFTSAQKVGVAFKDVVNATLGDASAKARVTAATNAYIKANSGSIGEMQNAARVTGKLSGAINTTSSAIDRERKHISQTNSALRDLGKLKVKPKIDVDINGAKKKVRDMQQYINGMHGKTVKIHVQGGTPGGQTKTGDTATSRARGGGNIGRTLAAHRAAAYRAGSTPTITNAFMGGGGHGRGSGDHQSGRALDLTGRGLHAYAKATRDAGGYAAFHGQGASRHLHAVPAGDTATSRARRRAAVGGGMDSWDTPPVIIGEGAIQVHNPASDIDLEQAVASGIEAWLRDRGERR